MKQLYHLSCFLLALLLPASALAHDFEVDGIYYNIINDNEVAVTYKGTSVGQFEEYTDDVTIPETTTFNDTIYLVTSISEKAFSNCKGLTSIAVPNSVTSIGNGAFSYCTALASINIPKSVSFIGGSAFENCTKLTNLIIPNSVTSIGNYAFHGCRGLKSIDIPNSVIIIGNSAFSYCTGLTSVTIGNSVTDIGNSTFQGCNALETLNYNAVNCMDFSITYSNYPFRETRITTINIGDSVHRIPAYFAYNLSLLTGITIPNSVAEIGHSAFQDCIGLTNITIPNSVTNISYSAFQGCSNLTRVDITDLAAWCNISFGGESANPLYYAHHFYLNNNKIISLEIPNSVTNIKGYAFSGYSSLASITIPNSVTSIGEYAFSSCTGLTGIAVPNSVTYIGGHAFQDCSNLTRVDITDLAAWCRINNDYYWEDNPFSYAHQLYLNDSEITDLVIPNTVTIIGTYAFSYCTGLSSVNIPNSVTYIGEGAFSNCSGIERLSWNAVNCSTNGNMPTANIKQVYIGDNVQTIPDNFVSNSKIAEVIIPNSVTSIGYWAFFGCSNLTRINIPNSVTTIADYAFSGCTALDTLNYNAVNCADFSSTVNYRPFYNLNISTINIGDSVQRIPNYFANGLAALTNVTIGKSVTSIGNYAFTNCNGIKQLTWNAINCSSNGGMPTANIEQVIIGEHVQTIPQYFVRYSKITEVAIPNSVTYIDYNAFYGCSNLTRVNITDLAAWCNIYFNSQIANPLYYAHHLFLNNNEIINLDIPDSVTNIGGYAFINCSDLTNVFIPNSITNIGGGAFTGCTSIKQFTWNAINCSTNGDMPTANIEQVTIGNEVQVIPNNFVNGSKIAEIVIPNTVTNIGYNAFYGCSGLASLTIGNSVTDIGSSAFSGCSGLTGDLTIPNSVTNIENNAFSGCSGLASLTIGNSVTTIGYNAFYGCSGLASLTIGNSVTDIGSSAFSGCSGLTGDLIIPASVVYINASAFQGCTGVETLNYNAINCADFTKNPSSHPFYNLNISVINIGDSVQRIPAYFAYGLQKLSSVTIPGSVTSVGTQAFYNCPIIESVTCLPTTPPSTPSTGDMALFNTNVYIHSPLYVPMGTEKSYMYDQGWGQFINIIGIKTQDDVLATDIMLDQSVMSLILGTSSQLVTTVLPDSTTNKVVSWASSNPNVATVDENGVVTAMGLGNAMITAITTDGSNLSATCRVIVTSVSETNGFAVADAEVMHGKRIEIPVAMNNDQTILAFQTDIYLPEGFSIVMDEDDEYMISPSNRLTDDHILMANESNGAVSVVCYTPEGRPIGGNSGDDLFYITVQVPEDASGDYVIYLRNSRLTTANYTELRVSDAGAVVTVKSYIPGDANDSRTVTVTDIVVTAQYVLQMNPEPFIFEAADMNGDGDVTVTDIMLIAYLINHPTMNAPKRLPALEGVNDSMSGEDVTLMADETRNVSIQLNNEMDYTAFQLDLTLPAGLIASNFQLTDRAGNHAFDVSTLSNGKTRVLCYSPAIEVIEGHEGVLLTFDVTATDNVEGSIIVDDIEMVTANCQTILMNNFTIDVNSTTSVNELSGVKAVAREDYFNLAGQQIDRPSSGVTLVVTTYTDGTRSTTKVIK